MHQDETKKINSLRINRELYSQVEKEAKKENRSINNFLETLIREALNYHEPNDETIQTIEESRNEKSRLKGYTDMDELFNDLAK